MSIHKMYQNIVNYLSNNSPYFGCSKKQLDSEGNALNIFFQELPEPQRKEVNDIYNNLQPHDWIISPNAELNDVKNNPYCVIEKLEYTLEYLCLENSNARRLFWLSSNNEHAGFEEYELAPILARWVHIEHARSYTVSSSKSINFFVGEMHRDVYSILLHLTQLPNNISNFDKLIKNINTFTLPIACICLDYLDILRIASKFTFDSFLTFLKEKKIKLGVNFNNDISSKNLVFLDFIKNFNEKREWPITITIFDDKAIWEREPKLIHQLSAIGIEFDCSYNENNLYNENKSSMSRDCYYINRHYQPMSFDARIPAPTMSKKNIIIFPKRALINPNGISKSDFIKKTQPWKTNATKIAELLDINRISAYFKNMESSLELSQAYHYYRIYNRPTQTASIQHTLLFQTLYYDKLDSYLNKTDKVINKLRHSNKKIKILLGDEFWGSVVDAIKTSYSDNIEQLLDQQVNGHHYLTDLPFESTLRQDIQNFVNCMPKKLGNVIELGSGYGQLAYHLKARSDFYLCTELNFSSFSFIKKQENILCVATDIHTLPFENSVFSTAIANNILEHLYDPIDCLKEVYRILIPGGSLFALIPLDALNEQFNIPTHLWKADVKSIELAMRESLFHIVSLEVIDLYQLGVKGAFPTCNGLVAKLHAQKLEESLCVD